MTETWDPSGRTPEEDAAHQKSIDIQVHVMLGFIVFMAACWLVLATFFLWYMRKPATGREPDACASPSVEEECTDEIELAEFRIFRMGMIV